MQDPDDSEELYSILMVTSMDIIRNIPQLLVKYLLISKENYYSIIYKLYHNKDLQQNVENNRISLLNLSN